MQASLLPPEIKLMIISHYIITSIDDFIHEAALIPFHERAKPNAHLQRQLAAMCSRLDELVQGFPVLRSHAITSLAMKGELSIMRTDEDHKSMRIETLGGEDVYVEEDWQIYRMNLREELIACELNRSFLEAYV